MEPLVVALLLGLIVLNLSYIVMVTEKNIKVHKSQQRVNELVFKTIKKIAQTQLQVQKEVSE